MEVKENEYYCYDREFFIIFVIFLWIVHDVEVKSCFLCKTQLIMLSALTWIRGGSWAANVRFYFAHTCSKIIPSSRFSFSPGQPTFIYHPLGAVRAISYSLGCRIDSPAGVDLARHGPGGSTYRRPTSPPPPHLFPTPNR